MVDEGSPSRVSNEELIENALILVQQLFAESSINGTERDHIKGMYPHFLYWLYWCFTFLFVD